MNAFVFQLATIASFDYRYQYVTSRRWLGMKASCTCMLMDTISVCSSVHKVRVIPDASVLKSEFADQLHYQECGCHLIPCPTVSSRAD